MYFRKKVVLANFILAVSVMFLHSHNIVHYPATEHTFLPGLEFLISKTVGNLAVPGFFLISSYLFYRNYGKDKILRKYRSRFWSVLVPYWLWNALYYLVFLALVAFPVSRYFMDTMQVEWSVHELAQAVLNHKYHGAYWFMQQLAWFVVLSPVIWVLMKKRWGIILPAVLLGWNYAEIHFPVEGFGLRLDMLVYWCVGCYLALHGAEKFEARATTGKYYYGMLFFVLLGIRFWLEFSKGMNVYNSRLAAVLLFMNVLVLWHALDILECRNVRWWMEITFFIYSTHPLLTDTVKKGMAKLLPNTLVFGLINYFATVGISLCVIIAVAKLLMNHMPFVWKILNGGRGVAKADGA